MKWILAHEYLLLRRPIQLGNQHITSHVRELGLHSTLLLAQAVTLLAALLPRFIWYGLCQEAISFPMNVNSFTSACHSFNHIPKPITYSKNRYVQLYKKG